MDNIICKARMGEFLLYYNNVLFGGIYDNRLLVKIVNTNKKYNMNEVIPYENAKPMYSVDDVDNKNLLNEIEKEFLKAKDDKSFLTEYEYYLKQYVGRPSPLYYAENLSKYAGGAKIF